MLTTIAPPLVKRSNLVHLATRTSEVRAASASPKRKAQAGARLLVDSAAVAHNVQAFARLMRKGRVMAVVKADGYGAGSVTLARAALDAGAAGLGVATIHEALDLRAAGINAPILAWLNPVTTDFEAAVAQGVDVAVPSQAHLEAVVRAASAAKRKARVHLQVDCGLAREGCAPEEWVDLFTAIAQAVQSRAIELVGLMGHLSSADTPEKSVNADEVRHFAQAESLAHTLGLRPQLTHLAATAATLALPEARGDMCRIGAGLLGIDPFHSGLLRPAVTLQAQVIDIREVPAETPVGYGHTWTTPHATRLAHVAAGYADGVPRHLSAAASVWLGGRRCPIIGRVSMDQVIVDLGDAPVKLGDYATFFGTGDGVPTLDEFATWCDTIPNEVATGIGQRVHRVLIGSTMRHQTGTVRAALEMAA